MSIYAYLLFLIVVLLFPTITNTIRCYKCDATDVCKTITSKSQLTDKYEIVDCEQYCWKTISLGNVYRGCGRKHCAVSYTIGTFSSSVCCQTDFCNKSRQYSTSNYLLIIIMFFVYIYL